MQSIETKVVSTFLYFVVVLYFCWNAERDGLASDKVYWDRGIVLCCVSAFLTKKVRWLQSWTEKVQYRKKEKRVMFGRDIERKRWRVRSVDN